MTAIDAVKDGYGEGSFVVISALLASLRNRHLPKLNGGDKSKI